MEILLSISVETKEWTEGNHAWFDAKLKPNSIIEISWGDGKKSTMKTLKPENNPFTGYKGRNRTSIHWHIN